MQSDIWITADHHFGGKNVCTWKDEQGNQVRPWNTPKEHDEALIELWNETVKPKDRVYVLGDFAMTKKAFIECGSKLNGIKRLIAGNHDIWIKAKDIPKVFDEVYGALTAKTKNLGYPFVMTHVPIHPSSINRKQFKYNVHGHLHNYQLDDPRYLCVSIEQTNFKPIHLDEVIKRLKIQNGKI